MKVLGPSTCVNYDAFVYCVKYDAYGGAHMYTERSRPPRRPFDRSSKWRQSVDEAREGRGEWRRVLHPLKRSTAQQMGSDIKSRREFPRGRFGILPGEGWQTSYGQVEKDGPWFVWTLLEEEPSVA